jgi:hypothetical protein
MQAKKHEIHATIIFTLRLVSQERGQTVSAHKRQQDAFDLNP